MQARANFLPFSRQKFELSCVLSQKSCTVMLQTTQVSCVGISTTGKLYQVRTIFVIQVIFLNTPVTFFYFKLSCKLWFSIVMPVVIFYFELSCQLWFLIAIFNVQLSWRFVIFYCDLQFSFPNYNDSCQLWFSIFDSKLSSCYLWWWHPHSVSY